MSQDKKVVAEAKLSEEEKLLEEKTAGFIESVAKTNTEKFTKEILEGLSEDTDDSDSYDAESGGEDSEDRPWRPSHAVFGKSTIKQSHLDNMRGRYFRDMSVVRADIGDRIVPVPEENEVVIYRSFFKAGLRFPLSRFVVEVLKIYQIFLHQITPEAIIRMGIFVWAVRSQGFEPSAKCFCSMHELSYETKPWGKEQYHNNFGCYSFVARSGSSCPVPTFRKRWPRDWMKEWFYVKNNLKAREDIKEIIMRPIWSRFGLRKPKVEIDEAAEGCRRAFGTVCSFIGTRDLVQEHVAYRIWPLIDSWEMPKETITNPSEGGLVRLKYTFRFGDQFIEPDDDWLKCVENTSDELLGAYSKSEDNALSVAFGSQKKKRLNRVFDAIGFMYPDYRYPPRGQKRKSTTSRNIAASAAPSEPAPKRKKLKVLTHRPRYLEPATVPEFGGETSSAIEVKEHALMQRTEEPAAMPKTDKIEEPRTKGAKTLEVLSPSAGVEVPKTQKGLAATPKRRMASVLDVLETIKASSSTPRKIAEASKIQIETETKPTEAEAILSQADAEAGPSVPAKEKSLETGEKAAEEEGIEQILPEKAAAPAPESSFEVLDYIIRHASGKRLSEEEIFEAKHYAQELKYPKGALVFNGTDEDDFLYCLPDNKELSVCREMARSMGFPKLEAGLCAMTKDDLANSLAYNSLKVQKLYIWKFMNFELFFCSYINSFILFI
jgi:hypothetical protein